MPCVRNLEQEQCYLRTHWSYCGSKQVVIRMKGKKIFPLETTNAAVTDFLSRIIVFNSHPSNVF